MPQITVTTTECEDGKRTPEQIVGADTHIFACLDANRIPNLPELLESGTARYACLFQGELVESVGERAPWLVRLNPRDQLFEQLLASRGEDRANIFGFWEAEAGIFLRSDMSLAKLQRHLRRFLRVHTPDNRTFFFRFWEPAIAAAYFAGLHDREDMIDRWFRTREGSVISQIIAPAPSQNTICEITVSSIEHSAPRPKGAFALSNDDIARFGAVRMDKDVTQITRRLAETFPDTPVPDGEALDTFVRTSMSRMMQYGFAKKSTLFTLIAWDLHFGPQFETRDPKGYLLHLMTDRSPPNERFDRLKARMSILGQ